ncbi:hypothetical protein [Gilliamella apicola]|uniref:Uncharacterized protein n=1 Tax=Gilliamella apicola TaxID=1196095 RepID=A0A242NKY7_9GAMM|nr:hypothetical protein [Gilliamella apicola]OTP81270.1 hypothetical protein B5S40_12275 [Gilliamella apicola]OTP85337.1 hypothetical protein B5S44_06105 [Gilliamella apicola]OTP87987.1 hypothetical protein B5S42_08890 [Gilliamella apicola]OTQ01134.1 hypothetical protein B6D08_01700 [Gilliamella apicola]OTQ10844.1 hypothetical protein B6C91_04470 [Gilliamella apicola]
MNSDFLNRPLWQQYLFCILLPVIIFIIGYLFFIHDINKQSDEQQKVYQTKLSKIKSLQSRLNHYQFEQNSSLTIINQNEFAQYIERNHLVLNGFKHYQTDETINWDIELNGNFIDFMNLISELNKDYYYLDFRDLKIIKQESYLQIIFTLLFKGKIE